MRRVSVFVLAGLFVGVCSSQVSAATYTGCLKSKDGTLYNVQEGNTPKASCAVTDSVISWNSVGPQGPAGPQGPSGPTGPQGTPGVGEPHFRFVGVTTQKYDGSGGLQAMNAACGAQYPGSRMAFIDETHSSSLVGSLASTAWINFRPVMSVANPNNGQMMVIDPAGNSLTFSVNLPSGVFSCNRWTTNDVSRSGAAIYQNGAFELGNCTEVRAIACAAPED